MGLQVIRTDLLETVAPIPRLGLRSVVDPELEQARTGAIDHVDEDA